MATHSNAPLTLRAVVVSANALMLAAPLAHVADEGGVSRTALTKWYKRWLVHGDPGLLDRTSRPDHQPARTPDDIEGMVIQLRTVEKWGPDRIAGYLPTVGDGSIGLSAATVWRILSRHGLSRLRDLDMPTGRVQARPTPLRAPEPGRHDPRGCEEGRTHPRGWWLDHPRARDRRGAGLTPGRQPASWGVFIHAAVDDHSRLAYAEVHAYGGFRSRARGES